MNNQLADIHDMLIEFMNEEEAGKILTAIENKLSDTECEACDSNQTDDDPMACYL